MSLNASRAGAVNHPAAALDLLRRWLTRLIPAEAAHWLDAEIDRQRDGVDERRLGIALGLVGRRIGRADLSLSAADLAAADALRRRWRPDMWGADEAARVALVLSTWRHDAEAFATRIDRMCTTAELTEHIALLKGLAVLPAPDRLVGRARDAARSSIQLLFEAIACHNPYPAEYFDEAAYNHLVVKCVFCEVPIATIVGLDDRRNGDLVQMLRDLVSERHAAGRVLPEAVHRWIASTAP
jgi:hypothetical protein